MPKSGLQLDDVNVHIIRELLQNARLSSREIAKRVGVSHQTVISRMRDLEEGGLINGYTACIDWEKFGHKVGALFLVETGKLSPENVHQLEKYVAAEKCFTHSGTISGDYDLFIIGLFQDQQEALEKTMALRDFLSKELDLNIFRTYNIWKTLTHRHSPI